MRYIDVNNVKHTKCRGAVVVGRITKHRLQRQLEREEQHKKWLKDNLPGIP